LYREIGEADAVGKLQDGEKLRHAFSELEFTPACHWLQNRIALGDSRGRAAKLAIAEIVNGKHWPTRSEQWLKHWPRLSKEVQLR
jgi:hypothetical protein